jgi:peptidoglycan/xylan/chitin deacetylase (PgdA/CDA1 family)
MEARMKKVMIPFLLAFLVLSSCTQSGLDNHSAWNGELPPKDAPLDNSIAVSAEDIAFVKAFMAGGARTVQSRAVVEGVHIAPVLILLYHHVSAEAPTNEYARSVAQLTSDFQFLRDSGIAVIGFDDLRKIQEGRRAPPAPRMAIISFDDGWKDQVDLAVPLLKQYGYKASFSITSSYIGDSGFMSWNDITKLAEYRTVEGSPLFTFISHTVTHDSLLDGSAWNNEEEMIKYLTYLKRQLLQSKRAIETRIAPYTYLDAPMILALPYGAGSGKYEITAMALRTGYSGIRTSDFGDYRQGAYYGALDAFTDDPFKLPSLLIYSDTDINVIQDYYAYLPKRLGFPTN